jgi:hypothetical protein
VVASQRCGARVWVRAVTLLWRLAREQGAARASLSRSGAGLARGGVRREAGWRREERDKADMRGPHWLDGR